MKKTISFLIDRLQEHSTWMSIAAGITAASTLMSPWSYLSLIASLAVALIPTKRTDKDND